MTPRLSRTAISAFTAVLTLALAPVAYGSHSASEQGDAGDLRSSAQDLGDAPVTGILGSFENAADADVYRLCLSDGSSFSASTVGATTLDTQMFLFDSDGYGVYANDDSSGSRGSLLPANHRFSPDIGGEYYLAISSYNRDPQSDQGEIFRDSYDRFFYPDGVLDPNGFGAAQPFTGWAGRAPGGPGLYQITITGSARCVPPDTTSPSIDLRSPQDGARVPQGASLEVDFSCADEGGSGLASCVGTTPDGAQLDTSELGGRSVTVTARDAAGNETVVTHTVTIVDERAPQVTLTSPADGAVYALGETVVADYSCADEENGSGLATCEGAVADGAPIDTSSLGEHAFEVSATDNAGNSATQVVTYRVAYAFDGFLWPVKNLPNVNRWKAGVPVPIRFSLGGNQGPQPEAPGYPRSVRCGDEGGEQVARSTRRRPVFRYDRRSDRYWMLWETERSWAGTCREFVLQLDDGSVHTARFEFVKKKQKNKNKKKN